MKKLIIAAILLIVLYCTYWFVMSGAVKNGALDKIASYEQAGYEIEHAPLKVSGFPLRFDAGLGPMTVRAPQTAMGEPGAVLALNTVSVSGKAYNPLAWSLIHTGSGQLNLPVGPQARWVFDTQTDRADIDILAGARGQVKRLAIEARDVRFTPIDNAPFPLRRIEAGDYRFRTAGTTADYQFKAENITLDGAQLGDIGRALGDSAQLISGTMQASDYGREAPRYVSQDLSLLWGAADMGGGFDLIAGPSGYSGKLILNVANEGALMQALTQSGVLSSGEAFMANMVISAMPQTEDERRVLTLTVRDNDVSLGPIKLGKLPL